MPKISIIMSVYNESDKIASTLTQIINFMGNYQPDFEIVISNDGSTDNTVELIKSYQKSEPRIVILDNVHFGKSYNIWRAMSAAKGDYILMTDADLAAPIQEIKKLFWKHISSF